MSCGGKIPTKFRLLILGMLLACSAKARGQSESTLGPSAADQFPVFQPPNKADTRYPTYITPYDIMTAEDEFYSHHLGQLFHVGDDSQWPTMKTVANLGADLLDAHALVTAAKQQMNVSEEPRAKAVMLMVRECAVILGIEPPLIHIEENAFPEAYVTGIRTPHMLILTSGLLELYADSPDELRFIIGHVLGHIKSRHLRTPLPGKLIMVPLTARLYTGGVEGVIASFTNVAFETRILKSPMHWYRASMFSADRAGLICVGGRVVVARKALARLLHQTRHSNQLMNKVRQAFEMSQIEPNHNDLRSHQMVDHLSVLYQIRTTPLFFPDRCVELADWTQSEEYAELINRPLKQNLRVQVTSIQIENIPVTDTCLPGGDCSETDPLVRITYAGQTCSHPFKSNRKAITWDQLDFRFEHVAGAGLMVDLYDDNTLLPNKLVGSVRLPVAAKDPGDYRISGTLAFGVENASAIIDLPKVVVSYRVEKIPDSGLVETR